jgi:hypothetical protein
MPHGLTPSGPLQTMPRVLRDCCRCYGAVMDTPTRRSRMRRTRTGKRIELTDRDLEIFRWLARYRYLPSTYIHAFVGGASETRFKERLGDLYHEGYLDRPRRQWEMANCRHRPVIHELDTGATRILDDGASWKNRAHGLRLLLTASFRIP